MKVISLRLSSDELTALEAAAKRERIKLGTWIKRAAMIDAERVNSQPLPENNPQSLPITPPNFEQ